MCLALCEVQDMDGKKRQEGRTQVTIKCSRAWLRVKGPDLNPGLSLTGLPWWLRQWRIWLQCRRPGVWSLCWDDPLEKGMTLCSSILVRRIPWSEDPGGLQSTGSQRVGHNWVKRFHFSLYHFMSPWVVVTVLVTRLCPTLCDPTDYKITRLLCPWDSPGKNIGVDCHSLLQRIFLTQGWNPGVLYCRQIFSHLSYREDLESP